MSEGTADPIRTAEIVRNEQLKLLATALNNTAVAAFVTSIVAPSVS